MKMYDKENNRLVMLKEKATPDFWDNQWEKLDLKRTYERTKNNKMYVNTLKKYVPDKQGQLLEGGCGLGQLVNCMHVHHYKCVGIDYSPKTIQRIKETFSELDVQVGDVRALPFPNDYFRGYWSIGVLEHFWNGYQDIVSEMRRVIAKNGFVFLMVPYMSPLRNLKAKLGLYKKYKKSEVEPEGFYQFMLNKKTLIKDFKAAGFKNLAVSPKVGVIGFMEEVSLVKPQLEKLHTYPGNNKLLKGVRYILDIVLSPFAGHSIFIVFQKE